MAEATIMIYRFFVQECKSLQFTADSSVENEKSFWLGTTTLDTYIHNTDIVILELEFFIHWYIKTQHYTLNTGNFKPRKMHFFRSYSEVKSVESLPQTLIF